MRYADVIVDLSANAVDRTFTYAFTEDMQVCRGDQVLVPFGPRNIEGFVLDIHDECSLEPAKVKQIQKVVYDYPVLLPELIDLAKCMHERYLCNLVDALRLMLPAQMRGERVHIRTKRMAQLLWTQELVEKYCAENKRAKAQHDILRCLSQGPLEAAQFSASALKALVEKGAVVLVMEETRRTPYALRDGSRGEEPELMQEQKDAVETMTQALKQGGGRFLLQGVTGSGKTEVYIRLIRNALQAGKNAIVLVPEIALTPQMVAWFHARFGADAAVLHSALSAGERFDEWRRIRFGEARVVIGARSAVFAPLENIGVIVVDEEHESSYQSDKRPRYDAREIAQMRAKAHGAVLILGSATPSISSYMRTLHGVKRENKLELIELRKRVKNRPLPKVDLVDMRTEFERGNHSIFSAKLHEALQSCLEDGKQAVLFINRRGYSSFVSCRACGYVVKCEHCDVTLTYHQTDNRLRCHYCGYETEVPKTCPQCGSRYIKYMGTGTQKVEEEVQKLFPLARTVRVDVDTTREKDAHQKLLDRFASGEANVLIGTQMIAKGLDFPKVTLVGAVMADMTLNLPDYRSVERTFQLVTQVAGRAGRAEDAGRVIVQTYDPEHYGIKLAAAQDYRAFYNRESEYRRKALYPPFTVIARILFSADEKEAAEKAAADAETELNTWIDTHSARRDVVQMRATEAPIIRLRGKWRYQVFLKMYFKGDTDGAIKKMLELTNKKIIGVEAELEVNPTNMV